MSILLNNIHVVPVPESIVYGFVMPVMVEESLWKQSCMSESSVNSQSLDCLLKAYANELQKQATRTDIVFDCRICRDSQSESKKSTIKLESSLEFDRRMKPYLLVKYH